MPSTFWSHTIWFVILGVFAIVQIMFALIKATDKKHVLALYIITSGATFCFEAIIYCFLRVYDYYPMILPHSPINDGLAGNLFSQFTLAATALFISVLDLKFYWILVFTGLYCLIEKLFLMLGIYTHNFYSIWITFFGLMILFTVTQKLYKLHAIYTKNKLLKYLFMSLALYTLHMPTAFWIQIISGIVTPSTELLNNDMKSFALVSLLNLFVLIIGCLTVYFIKIHFTFKAVLTVSFYIILYVTEKAGLIHVKSGWFLFFATIDIFSMYFFIFIMDKLMTNNEVK